MINNEEFVEACEALAESFEQHGRADLAALCDRAAYWLDGGTGLDVISLAEVVTSCRETLQESFGCEKALEDFIVRVTGEIEDNLRTIQAAVASANSQSDDLLDRAAKLQAVALLTSDLFQRRRT